jgi:hypothetical protein
MTTGFIIPEPNWGIVFPNINIEEWNEEEDDE